MIDMSLTNIAVAAIPMPAPARSGRNDKNICSFKALLLPLSFSFPLRGIYQTAAPSVLMS